VALTSIRLTIGKWPKYCSGSRSDRTNQSIKYRQQVCLRILAFAGNRCDSRGLYNDLSRQ
jgi:hypothetical protein